MFDADQANQYEMLTGLALQGGYYNWNTVPISDGDPERGDFEISRPFSGLQKEAAKVSPRMAAIASGEPHVGTGEYQEAGPRNPYAAPSRVVPWTPGRHLNEQLKPRTDKGPLPAIEAVLKGELFVSRDLEFNERTDAPRRHEILFCSDDEVL